MKNLYKKLSVIVLAGALFIGGPLSNGLMAYADSYKPPSEDEVDRNDMIVGSYQYGYKIISGFIGKPPKVKKIGKHFLGGIFFRWDLYNYGMKKGYYLVKAGGLQFLLYFPNDVPAGIPWWIYDNVPGGYYGDSK